MLEMVKFSTLGKGAEWERVSLCRDGEHMWEGGGGGQESIRRIMCAMVAKANHRISSSCEALVFKEAKISSMTKYGFMQQTMLPYYD